MNSKSILVATVLIVICYTDLFSCNNENISVLWSHQINSNIGLYYSNPITLDGVVYILSQNGLGEVSHLLGFDQTGSQVIDIVDREMASSPWLYYNKYLNTLVSQYLSSSGPSYYNVYDLKTQSIFYSFNYSFIYTTIISFDNLIISNSDGNITCSSPIDLEKVFWDIPLPTTASSNPMAIVSDVDQTTYFHFDNENGTSTTFVAVDIHGNQLWTMNYDLMKNEKILNTFLTYEDMLVICSSQYTNVVKNQAIVLRINNDNNFYGVSIRSDLDLATLYVLNINQLSAYSMKSFQLILNNTFAVGTWQASMALEKDQKNNTILNLLQHYGDGNYVVRSVDGLTGEMKTIFELEDYDVTFYPNDDQSVFIPSTSHTMSGNVTSSIGVVSAPTSDFTFSFFKQKGNLNF